MDAVEERRQAVAAELASEPSLWWGHQAEHGWVVLDRQDGRNQGNSRHLIRCRDWASLEVSRAEFASEQFTWFKNHLAALPHTQAPQACEQLLAYRRAFVALPRVIRTSAWLWVRGDSGAPLDEVTSRQIDGAASDCGLASGSHELAALGITGGRVKLTRDPKVRRFWAIAEYEAPGRLVQADLVRLKEDTEGDWSDGVGGSFFERLGESRGIAVTVSRGGDLLVEQLIGRTSVYGPWTELAVACCRGNLEQARAALDAGEDVNARADGLPVLQAAIARGQAEVALLLIDRGADVHGGDLLDEQRDALMSCVISTRLGDADAARIARALLQRGADGQAPRNRGGDTPLDLARRREKGKLIRALEEFVGTASS
jgi:hypothetical protein